MRRRLEASRGRRVRTVAATTLAIMGAAAPGAGAALTVDSTADGSPTATALAQSLAGAGVSVSNATFTGAPVAAGAFAGGTGIIGFEDGVILGSGDVASVIGPNVEDGKTTINETPGDPDLDALVGAGSTQDAAVLGFDLVPDASRLTFSYVFSSDEYNEFVSEGVLTGVNDVFAFFVNGRNCAVVPATGDPVSINTINGGNPFGNTDPQGGTTAKQPELYRNNDLQDGGGTIDTEMDGLTVVLTCTADVTPGQPNRIKLAIADRGDSVLDSNVFLQRGSFVAPPPPPPPDTTPPQTAITAGPAGPVATATPTFSFLADEAGSSFQCSVDGGPFAPCTSPFTTGPLRNGAHTLDVVAIDAAGNRSAPARRAFTVAVPPDADGDGIPDARDSCPSSGNPSQADRDRDGIGDACDTSDASGGPKLFKSVVARLVSGEVFVRLPAGSRARTAPRQAQAPPGFIPLKGAALLPVGTIVDAARGRLALTAAASRTKTERSEFYDGIFQLRQKRAPFLIAKRRVLRPVTELTLRSANFRRVCGTTPRAADARAAGAGPVARFVQARRSKKVVSRLWGNGKGRFRTTGRHSAATVRGTIWLTQERCDGTLTRVTRGVVRVFDTGTKKTVTVRAGSSYLARAVRASIKAPGR